MTPSTGWHDFAVMTGGASGALTGQLFVAISLKVGRIAERRALRASAAQTLLLFLVRLVMAMVLLAPGHVCRVMGCELIAAGMGRDPERDRRHTASLPGTIISQV
jgi:hypothetical protein